MRRPVIEELTHALPLEEACARLRALTDYWDSRFGTRTRWDGSRGHISGKVLGIRFEGTFSVEEERLRGQLRSGFLGERLGGRSYVLRKLADYLDPSRPLAELQARVARV